MNDLTGKVFGKLAVLGEGKRTKKGVGRWLCLCSCGNKVQVTTYNLLHGISRSCRCLGREMDLTGRTFGQLTVLEKVMNTSRRKEWRCHCTCGKTVIVRSNNLRTGNTTSCGCARGPKGPTGKRIPEKDSLRNDLYSHYRSGARRRNLSFSLTKEEFSDLVDKPCQYCGWYPDKGFNGIDRIDSDQGYSKGNCVPCCSICNNAKKKMPVDVFIEWGLKLGRNLRLTKGGLNG